jgi:SAM-dependent methyltransferase
MKKCISCSHHFESESWVCPRCNSVPATSDDFIVFSPELARENSGFRSDYFETLARLEEDSFWFRARNRLVVWALGKYLPNAQNFLEIGCGTGYVITGVRNAFPEMLVSGSDIFLAGLPYARKRLPHVPLFQMDARVIPFFEEYDVVGAFDVLEHIEEDRDVLKEMYNAVRSGGGVLLSVPQHAWLWSQIDDASFHKRRYDRKDFVQKIESAGFHVRKVTSFVSLLLPLMALVRLRYLFPSQKKNYHVEFKLGNRVNSILENVMDLELYLIRSGMNFCLGGSLFVVAAKE